jgi:lysophospholipase L1-like esterase
MSFDLAPGVVVTVDPPVVPTLKMGDLPSSTVLVLPVAGPAGPTGGAGSPTGSAGGALAGSYPNPTIAAGAIGTGEVASSIKDPAAATAGLRTLGTGAQQACAGNDSRLSDTRTPTTHTHSESDVTGLVSDLGARVLATRSISAGTGLTGGGDLSANRSLAVAFGATAGTVVQGNDSRMSDSRAPNGSAGGSLAGTYPNPTIAAAVITGTEISAAIKDPIAATPGLRTLGTGSQQAVSGNDSRLSDSRVPSGAAGGDLMGTYPNPSRASKYVPATSRGNTNAGPGGGVTGLVTNAGATAYILTEVRPPVVGAKSVKLRYWNGRTFDGSPGEVNGPNAVTIRAALLYPAGVWRQVSGSTAWASGTTYNAGDMVTNGGKIWVAYGPPITVGAAPSEGTQWTEARKFPVSFTGQDANRRVSLAIGAYIDSLVVDFSSFPLKPGINPYLGILTTIETGSASNLWCPGDISTSGIDFVVNYATTGAIPTPGGALDPVDSGFTNQTNAAAGTSMPMPVAVFAGIDPVSAPDVLGLVGDSTVFGFNDTPGIERLGWAGRASDRYAWMKSAQSGSQAAHFNSSHTFRDVMLAMCDAIVVTFGGNELVNSKSLATIQSDFTTLWKTLRALGPRVWATTVTPITTSTDAFATVANQTAYNASFGTAGTTYANLLKWLRDGAPIAANGQNYRAGQPGHPLLGILDTAPPLVDPTSPWKWRAPGYTADGAHPSALAAQTLASWARPWMPTIVYGAHLRPLSREALYHLGAWTTSPEDATSTLLVTGGTIYVAKIQWPGGTLYQLHTWVTTAGATLTSGQNLMGVYTPDGSLLGVTATQHTAWTSVGDKVAPLVTPVWAPAGELFLAWVSVGTTKPTFAATPAIAASPSLLNTNLPVSVLRSATAATGQTSLPSPLSLTSLTAFTQVIYGAAS